MASFFNYKILPEQRIFLQYFKGTINFDITIAGMSKVVQDNEFDSSFNSIVDFRGAHFQYTDNDIIKFREFLKIKNLVDNQRRVAFLTNTPNQVVLLTLFSINKDN